jgi:hypothetical protein
MKANTTLFITLLLLAFLQNANAQTFVDANATGNNDGSSWANAYIELATALDNYSPGDEIWVAAGTYLPQEPVAWPGEPENTFYIYQDLKLYGGFAGTETMLSERDPAANETILSGDLNGDDIPDDFETLREDNATSVVFVDTVITAATVIDGFTIRNGHAAGDTAIVHQTIGGGIMAWGSPQISQCRFTQNFADVFGGGLYLFGEASAEASVTDCIFEGNLTAFAGGGMAIVTIDSSKVVPVHNCQFIGNSAGEIGGGMAVRSSSAELNNCAFTDNTTEGAGGGIIVYALPDEGGNYQVSLTECDFTENVSGEGGAFYYQAANPGNDVTLTSCNFIGNQSISTPLVDFPDGGGIEFFYNNDGPQNDTIQVVDCVFEDNTTERFGGGMLMVENSGTNNYLAVTGCNFSGNTAPRGGGGFIHFTAANGSNALVSDCVFENNEGAAGSGILYQSDGTNTACTVKNCDFIGNVSTGTGPSDNGGGGIWLLLSENTPSGDNSFTIDSCHFENNEAARFGGGFFVTDVSLNNEVEVLNSTFISNTARFGGGVQVEAIGENFQMQLSNCAYTGNQASEFGGGFGVENRDPNLQISYTDCLFDGNSADIGGGGLEVVHSGQADGDISIKNTDFLNNTASNEGAGLNFNLENNASGSLSVESTLFSGNNNDASGTAEEGAGGFSLNNFGFGGHAKINLQACVFENNSSQDGAGAINLYKLVSTSTDTVDIENCLLNSNSGGSFGGGIGLNGEVVLTLTNNTIADNSNGGIVLVDGSLFMQNNILDNPNEDDFLITSNDTMVASLGGNLIGDSTMDDFLNSTDQSATDPLFEAGTYELSQNSPAVDAGVLPDNPPSTDLAGADRIQGGCIDIGAFESPYDAGTPCLTTNSRAVWVAPSSITVYPNPVVTTTSIALENEWRGSLHIRVVDALGKVVFVNTFEKYNDKVIFDFDASELPTGMFQLVISNGESTASSTLVKI